MRDRLIELIKKGQPPFNALNAICISVLADYLLENGIIVPPCKVGDEINGGVVCEVIYSETLGIEGNIRRNKQAYTCDKTDIEKKIRVEHPMTWEKIEQELTCQESRQVEEGGARE